MYILYFAEGIKPNNLFRNLKFYLLLHRRLPKIKKRKKTKLDLSPLALVTSIGLNMTIPIILTILFGDFLDDKLGTSPLFLLIFIVLGVMAAFRNLFMLTKNEFKDKK